MIHKRKKKKAWLSGIQRQQLAEKIGLEAVFIVKTWHALLA